MNKEQKAKLRAMTKGELKKHLWDKEHYLKRFKKNLRDGYGTSAHTRNYPTDEKPGQKGNFGNIRKMKKEIATIKTIMRENNG